MTVHTVHSVRTCVDVVGERDRLDSLRLGRRLRPGRRARVCVLSLNEGQTHGRTARNQGGKQPLSACHADIEQGSIRRRAYTLRARSPGDSERKRSEGRDRFGTCQRIFSDALVNASVIVPLPSGPSLYDGFRDPPGLLQTSRDLWRDWCGRREIPFGRTLETVFKTASLTREGCFRLECLTRWVIRRVVRPSPNTTGSIPRAPEVLLWASATGGEVRILSLSPSTRAALPHQSRQRCKTLGAKPVECLMTRSHAEQLRIRYNFVSATGVIYWTNTNDPVTYGASPRSQPTRYRVRTP